MKRVAVCGSGSDVHVRYVARAIERQGARVLFVDTALVPERKPLSWSLGKTTYDGCDLTEIRAVYVKSLSWSLPAVDPFELPHRNFARWQDKLVAERERHSFLGAVLRELDQPHVTFVNPLDTFSLHYMKPHQLGVLMRAGLPVPDSLATCDPEAARAFLDSHEAVICKPLAGGAHVRKVEAADANGRLDLVRNAPVLLQEQVVGEEFRAYVLDSEPVKAFRVPTGDAADARENVADCVPAELPEEAWELCVRAASALGLTFTAADLRRRSDGRFVILELNPTPAISFYDDPREGKVISRLASFLVAHA
ncbi:RimK family alpha-L-glutamate ligase [Planctomycetota bacterium]